jgi:hypothetical protein
VLPCAGVIMGFEALAYRGETAVTVPVQTCVPSGAATIRGHRCALSPHVSTPGGTR